MQRNEYFPKEEIQLTKRHIKKCFQSLITWKMQIKTTITDITDDISEIYSHRDWNTSQRTRTPVVAWMQGERDSITAGDNTR